MSNLLFKKRKDLSEKLNCSWGDKDDLYLLKKDLSIDENLKAAMNQFPMLKKLVEKYKFSSKRVERCKRECNNFVFSEGNGIWQLKEFFRHWLMSLYP